MSDACPDKCDSRNSTYMYVGVMMTLTIMYDNTGLIIGESDNEWGIGFGDTKYQLRVTTEESTTFNVQVTQHSGVNSNRTIHHIHGLRYLVSQTGNVGDFDYNTLMLQATTSVALVAVSTSLVDVLMQYFLPDSDKYKSKKYEKVEAVKGEHGVVGSIVGALTCNLWDVDRPEEEDEEVKKEEYKPGVRDGDTLVF